MILKKDSPPWSIFDAFVVLALMFAGGYFASLFLVPLKSGFGISDVTARFFLASLVQNGIIALSLVYFVIFKYRISFKELGLRGINLMRDLVTGLRGGFALLLLVVIAGALIERIIPGQSSPQPFAKLVLETHSKKDLLLAFFAGVVIAPVGEELYFRAFLYPALKARMGIRLGILAASLVFAALHFDLVRFIPLALGGAGLAYLYQRTGSLLTSIFAHATWNLAMFTLLLLASSLSS
ncbi:MAG: CPBP family intramembrane glutamic endopeptidase [Bacillota bacterium]